MHWGHGSVGAGVGGSRPSPAKRESIHPSAHGGRGQTRFHEKAPVAAFVYVRPTKTRMHFVLLRFRRTARCPVIPSSPGEERFVVCATTRPTRRGFVREVCAFLPAGGSVVSKRRADRFHVAGAARVMENKRYVRACGPHPLATFLRPAQRPFDGGPGPPRAISVTIRHPARVDRVRFFRRSSAEGRTGGDSRPGELRFGLGKGHRDRSAKGRFLVDPLKLRPTKYHCARGARATGNRSGPLGKRTENTVEHPGVVVSSFYRRAETQMARRPGAVREPSCASKEADAKERAQPRAPLGRRAASTAAKACAQTAIIPPAARHGGADTHVPTPRFPSKGKCAIVAPRGRHFRKRAHQQGSIRRPGARRASTLL